MSAKKTILAFGETLWDVFPTGAKLGGAPLNFAYRMNSLGDRGIVVSRLGRDDLGTQAYDAMSSLGLDTAHVQWDEEHPTGTVPVVVDEKGNPDFTIIPDVAYDYMEVTDALLALAREADCICFGTLAQRTEPTRRTLEQALGVSEDSLKLLDVNLRKDCYSTGTVTGSLERSDVLKLNEDEAAYLSDLFDLGEVGARSGSAAAALPSPAIPGFASAMIERWSLSHCLVTLGERGAFASSAGGEAAYVPGYKVDTVDTCGSGDAFTAGFIHRLVRGGSLAECCDLGNALGAMVARQEGGTESVTPDEIKEFMASSRERVPEPALEPYRRA
ncbi:MAG: carbohydrate kinase family protein [Planctomycetota bacterium]